MKRGQRGTSLLTVVILIAIMGVMTAGVLRFSGQERVRAVQRSRVMPRNYCAETGLQMARAYFGPNQKQWNTFLSAPGAYNPVKSSCNPTPSMPGTVAGRVAIQAAHPELVADLDGDGLSDVYIYIRDNVDELGGIANCARDNDLQVTVGAVCFSATLAPRRDDGTVDQTGTTLEGSLQYNPSATGYAQRCGATGNCNVN